MFLCITIYAMFFVKPVGNCWLLCLIMFEKFLYLLSVSLPPCLWLFMVRVTSCIFFFLCVTANCFSLSVEFLVCNSYKFENVLLALYKKSSIIICKFHYSRISKVFLFVLYCLFSLFKTHNT